MAAPRQWREQQVLEYINTYNASCGISPTIREIMDGVGFRSTSSVHRYLLRLENEGKLERSRYQRRQLKALLTGE